MRLELNVSGLKAYYVETLSSALGVIEQWQFDAALVDAERLENEILDVVKSLRDRTQIPVLAILRSEEETLLLKALEAGASQVLAYPPSPRVIAAQLHRLVEVTRPRMRAERTRDDKAHVQVGPLRLHPRRAVATVDGTDVGLTATEFELLLLLASAAGELVHRDAISRMLRAGIASERRSVDMHVCRIRRKLKSAGAAADRLEVATVYKQGYLLKLAPKQAAGSNALRVNWSV
ncbi:MAG: winged helix-turn-helix domain-containing protein [Pseudomonadota bacterium]|nr:winged helix-turn-helix domain-containing protein [Pseudomonadota bacterium]